MFKNFLRHVLPSMLAFAFSGLYTIVDGFFVGRSTGDIGLAAINLAYPLTALVQAVGTGIGMGGAVCVAVYRGKNDPGRERACFSSTVSLLALASVAMTLLLLLLGGPLLTLFGAEAAVRENALAYLRIIAGGAVFQLCATGLTPLLRNYGASLLAMGTMIAGFVTNIVLDALFVSVLSMGVAGAAWATVIGQAVTVVPCALFLAKKAAGLGLRRIRFPDRAETAGILRVGLSPFGLTMSPNLIIVLMNRAVALHGGETAVAAYAVIVYVTTIIQLLLQGIGDGCQPLVSFYLGLEQPRKARAVRNLAYGFSLLVAVGTSVLLLALGGSIPAFFGASGQSAPLITAALPVFVLGFLPIAFCRCTTSYFYAVQKNASAYLLVYGEPAALCLLLAFVFPRLLGLSGVWLTVPATQLLLALAGLLLLWRDRIPKSRISGNSVPRIAENPES